MSLEVEVDDEAVDALWGEVWLDLEHLAASGALSEALVEGLRGLFLHILADLGENALVCVALPADGASENVMRLGVRRSLKRAIAACAFDLSRIGHGNLHEGVN